MTSRIASAELQTTRFDPAEAEVTVVVVPEPPAEGLTLRGKLTGPHTAYAETVEIAYQLRPLPSEDGLPRARVVIPEASLWDPEAPSLYRGTVELWHGDQCRDRAQVSHGLRNVYLKRGEFRLNGMPLRLHGLAVEDLPEPRRLHEAGYNLLVVPVGPALLPLWDLAEQYGLFLIGAFTEVNDDLFWLAERHLSHRTATLGWLVPQAVMGQKQWWHQTVSVLRGTKRHLLLGVQLSGPLTDVLPGEAAFLGCPRTLVAELGTTTIPLLVQGQSGGPRDAAEPSANVLGTVYRRGPE